MTGHESEATAIERVMKVLLSERSKASARPAAPHPPLPR